MYSSLFYNTVPLQNKYGREKAGNFCCLLKVREKQVKPYTVQITFIFIDFRICDFVFAF